jgi:hypothetical protein
MDEQTLCPACHVVVRPGDYYCFNCGKNLHPAPPSLSFGTLAGFFVGSLVLPPMGIIWGFRYIKSPDMKAKVFGFLLAVCTIIELVVLVSATVYAYNTINDQVQKQLPNIQGF